MDPASYLGNETVTVVHAPLVTNPRDNSKVRDWAAATTVDVPYCNVQPFLMSNKLIREDNNEREFSQQFFRVWMPAGTAIHYQDRIVHRGITMDIFGGQGNWYDFEGNEDHIQFVAVLREG